MKRIILLLSMIIFLSDLGFSQSEALKTQFALHKLEMASHGYTLVDEGVISLKQERAARGDLSAYSNSTSKVYTYSMLFKKKNK